MVAFAEGVPCSVCGEEVSRQATKCRHCKEWLAAPPAGPPTSRRAVALVVIGLLLVMLGVGYGVAQAVPMVLAKRFDDRATALRTAGGERNHRLAAGFYEKAAGFWTRASDLSEAAGSLQARAYCMQPDNDSTSTWARAAEAYARAAALSQRAGEVQAQATSVFNRAWCLEEGGRPLLALAQYRAAADLYAKAGDPDSRGDALDRVGSLLLSGEEEGESLDPSVWAEAEEAYEGAAQAYRQSGDAESEGLSLWNQARCARPDNNPSGSWERAAALFAVAAKLERTRGSARDEADALDGQATCLRPDNDPAGSWAEAAGLYRRAVVAHQQANNPEGVAWSRYWRATCLLRDGGDVMSSEAREEFQQALEGANEEDLEVLVGLVEKELRRAGR